MIASATARSRRTCGKLHQYSPDWARTAATTTNLGLLYRGELQRLVTVDASAFRSIFDLDNADYTLISSDAQGERLRHHAPDPERRLKVSNYRRNRGWAARFDTGDFSHLVTLSLRGRRSHVELASSLAIPLGAFNLATGDPPDVPERPGPARAARTTSSRYTASAGYGLAWRDRVQLRFGGPPHALRQEVRSTPACEPSASASTTLYNASAIVSLTDRTRCSAAGSRGWKKRRRRPRRRPTATRCCRRWRPSSSSWACATP